MKERQAVAMNVSRIEKPKKSQSPKGRLSMLLANNSKGESRKMGMKSVNEERREGGILHLLFCVLIL